MVGPDKLTGHLNSLRLQVQTWDVDNLSELNEDLE